MKPNNHRILKSEQSTTKVLKNINHCLAHGTQMGWQIDRHDRSVFICMPDSSFAQRSAGKERLRQFTFQIIDEPSTILPVPEFAASIQLTVERLFSWIKKFLLERYPTHIQLAHIYLFPEYQRLGIGSALINTIIVEASESNIPIRFHVMAVNPAKKFYEQLGFAITKSTPDLFFMEKLP
jgi:ribosomal protein S18 acetylase RimI-like enzyme